MEEEGLFFSSSSYLPAHMDSGQGLTVNNHEIPMQTIEMDSVSCLPYHPVKRGKCVSTLIDGDKNPTPGKKNLRSSGLAKRLR